MTPSGRPERQCGRGNSGAQRGIAPSTPTTTIIRRVAVSPGEQNSSEARRGLAYGSGRDLLRPEDGAIRAEGHRGLACNPSRAAELGGRQAFVEAAGQGRHRRAPGVWSRRDGRALTPLMDAWLPVVGIADFDFQKIEHRIALGEAYVFHLHKHGFDVYRAWRTRKVLAPPDYSATIP